MDSNCVLLLFQSLLVPELLDCVLDADLWGDAAFLIQTVEFNLSYVVNWLVKDPKDETDNLDAFETYYEPND